MDNIGIFLDSKDAKMLTRAHQSDVGYDIYSIEDCIISIGQRKEVRTGVHLILPEGLFAQVNTRSSYGKNGYYVHHGVIDPGYTGEVSIFVFNLCGVKELEIKKGDKIAQIIFHKAEYPQLIQSDNLPITERGGKGFGSSGR
jgi:dUTP pyrophosphatase